MYTKTTDRDPNFDQWFVHSSYQRFIQEEDVPVYEGSALPNLGNLPLGDWKRRGGKAAYTRMGDQETNGLQIIEIPPGGELRPEHHVYDAVMYVMSGHGATTIWQEGEPKHTVEWHEGSLLAIPLNAWHQEFNNSGQEPARILFGTNMPHVMNFYNNLDFIFKNPVPFLDRYSYETENYFDFKKHWGLRVFETNFVADCRQFNLDAYPERGNRIAIMRFSMASANLGFHVMSVNEGTYATAHRHGAGAHVIVIEGTGYELLYMPGDEKNRQKVDASAYAVVAPRHAEFHHHFNSGKGEYKMLAFRGHGLRYGEGRRYDPAHTTQSADPNQLTFMIPFEKEDPAIREEYYRELEKNGVEARLLPINQGAN